MRIAFGSQPIYSHLVPAVLPLARSAADAGHEVAVLTSPELSEQVHSFGLTPLPLRNAASPREMFQRPELRERLGLDLSLFDELGRRTMRTQDDHFAAMFAGPVAGDSAEEAVEVLKSFAPDLLVRESTDHSSYYAAEYLGLRHTALDIGPLGPFNTEAMLTTINEQRDRLDLEPVTDPLHPFRSGRIGMAPESFYPESLRIPSASYYSAPPPRAEQLDPEIAKLPGDRPLVLATLGSNAAGVLGGGELNLLNTIVEVLGDLRVTGVVALGSGTSPEDWTGSRPDNVHLTSFAQQQLLLPACEAFITHGGFNGVREALSSGIPMVVLPIFAEQPANAERVEQLELGKRLNLEDVDHDSLRTAVGTVLADSAHRHRARAMAREFRALAPFDEIVPGLERQFEQR
ncbi:MULTISPECIES: glycosyltransferase [Actinopolyspora]|uniref:N-glycosyltransferase n=1 Tax=Actinopolyspora saharensis TaxID=995062 RepID=A0A1H1AJE9_9ACTN|nr:MULTISPECIES: glycosyltransferase [Actinopolyspora]NHD17020.1 glycosyltransferase family 1 protein [Actinopolyspora sp. BKK2]NHE76172.1 glycosyltransferase family 1 protein [Actinopolyspora sp. BKK1]SDQ39808.1 N-glycosyltransferase [Actinopolyspora saharensis]